MDVVANLILLDVASRTYPDSPPSAQDLSALAQAAIAEIDRLREEVRKLKADQTELSHADKS